MQAVDHDAYMAKVKADAELAEVARRESLRFRGIARSIGAGLTLIALSIAVSMRYQIIYASATGTLAYKVDNWTGAVYVVTPQNVREITSTGNNS